jgi:hypothetical protein
MFDPLSAYGGGIQVNSLSLYRERVRACPVLDTGVRVFYLRNLFFFISAIDATLRGEMYRISSMLKVSNIVRGPRKVSYPSRFPLP